MALEHPDESLTTPVRFLSLLWGAWTCWGAWRPARLPADAGVPATGSGKPEETQESQLRPGWTVLGDKYVSLDFKDFQGILRILGIS